MKKFVTNIHIESVGSISDRSNDLDNYWIDDIKND